MLGGLNSPLKPGRSSERERESFHVVSLCLLQPLRVSAGAFWYPPQAGPHERARSGGSTLLSPALAKERERER